MERNPIIPDRDNLIVKLFSHTEIQFNPKIFSHMFILNWHIKALFWQKAEIHRFVGQPALVSNEENHSVLSESYIGELTIILDLNCWLSLII